jgi:hypothetical protein
VSKGRPQSYLSLCPCLYVLNRPNKGRGSINIYARGSRGNVLPINGSAAPAAVLSGSQTLLNRPTGIALDSAGNINVTDYGNASITTYAAGSRDNAKPTRVISGSNTDLYSPSGIALDGTGDVYVSNGGFLGENASVTVYASDANGNATPIRMIAGTETGLHTPCGVGLDSAGSVYVVDCYYHDIAVFAPSANGNVKPIRKIAGPRTKLTWPIGITLSPHGQIYTVNQNNPHSSVELFAADAKDDAAPLARIYGSLTMLNGPNWIALDSKLNMYVTNSGNTGITVYTARANGNVRPKHFLSGSRTLLDSPQGLVYR